MSDKVVLAYSGGLDTSVAIRWLKEKYNVDIIALTVDVGNERDFTAVREKALKAGAVKALYRTLKSYSLTILSFPHCKPMPSMKGNTRWLPPCPDH